MTIGGALSELNNLLKADDIPCYYKPSIKAVIETIALEQKTGYWKRTNIVQHATACYRCSECGKVTIGEHNYCPNCGLKME